LLLPADGATGKKDFHPNTTRSLGLQKSSRHHKPYCSLVYYTFKIALFDWQAAKKHARQIAGLHNRWLPITFSLSVLTADLIIEMLSRTDCFWRIAYNASIVD